MEDCEAKNLKETVWISENTSSQLVSLIDGTDSIKGILILIL